MRGFQPANKKLTKGGPVRGPGTGTSDDVADTVADGTYIMPTDSTQAIGEQHLAAMGKGAPVDVQLSNGEFKIPPDQVHAVGVQALDQMKDATHTPVAARGFAPGAQQEEPPLFFANGGVVDEENRRRFAQVPDTIGQQPGRQQPSQAPEPIAPVSTPASVTNQDTARPSSASAPPIAAKANKGAAPVSPTALYFDDGAADVAKRWDDGSAAGAVGAAVRTGVGTVGMAGVEALDNTVGAAGRGIGRVASGFWDGLVGNDPVTPKAAMPAAPSPAPAAQTAVPSANLPAAGSGVMSATDVAQAPAAPVAAPTVPAVPQASQVMPGVFRSGNSYGDTAATASAGAQPRGLPLPQNVAAADALAQRTQQQSVARIASGQGARGLPAPQEQPGWSGVIGSAPGVDRERQDLVSSLTTPLRGAQNGQLTAAQRNGMLQLRDQEARASQAQANNATSLQQAEMQGNTQRDVAAMREAGDTGRAAMRETGEAGRANARNAIDQDRLKLDKEVRGFDIRAGQRQEKLHERYAAADTPEKKAAIAQEMRDLSGKQTESPWKIQVTPQTKNIDGSTTAGSIVRYNTQTGQVESVDMAGQSAAPVAMPADKSKRVVGQTYTAPNGQLVRWTAAGGLPI